LIRTLRGLTATFGCFDSEPIEESSFERRLAGNPYLRLHECWYWIRKMQARYFAGDYQDALDASTKAQGLLWISPANLEEAECHFYSALCRAASHDGATGDERRQHLEALAQHQQLLEMWAGHCPENFDNRAALVGAEIARIEGRDLDAMRLYEQAIRSSRTSGFVHNEALAYERASAFYRARGFEQITDTYLRNARACYATWGAEGKVRQLDRLYPGLKQEHSSPGPGSTITAPVEGLDLATVIRVSQAVSSEIVLEKLFETVMRKAMEHAGAERGLLLIAHGDEFSIAAASRISGSEVIVSLTDASAAAPTMPQSILRYVMRTHESVILDDASSANPFSTDPYVLQSHVRSMLCLPLLNQAKVSGILYLENNLAPRVFTADRLAVLEVLISQAAISLENTRLYRDLEDREAKIRALKDELYHENLALRDELDRTSMFEEIVGTSKAIKNVIARISKVAPAESTVLITGETGTGKELAARAIHRRSRRSARPFVGVNCAAIPRELIASELFGHEKGAFTGALQRRLGRFELAAQGTIFLDEVGELSPDTQVALLRVLQEREFERVGGTAVIRTDGRVIAATNRELEAEIAAGRFRSDLFYRLNVFPIEMPALRDRGEDLPLLIQYFLDRYARNAGKSFESLSKRSLQLLQSYPWPGNIRELQNVIERSVIISESTKFSIDESWLARPHTADSGSGRQLAARLVAQEKEMIETALRESGGRVSGPYGAAQKLGMPGSTLESKIKSLRIDKIRFKA